MKLRFFARLLFALMMIVMSLSLCSCGEHYCSYGGCMVKVEHAGDRCSKHKGKENNPYYGWPSDMIPADKKYKQWD